MQSKSWTEKYRPEGVSSLLGNEEAVLEFKAWLESYASTWTSKKACLLVGPPGVGKTSLSRAAAADCGRLVVEMNASDVRTEKAIMRALAPASTSLTLDSFSNKVGNMILLDEVDGVFGREDRGGLPAITSAIKNPPVPIVLTANDVEGERFEELRKACLVIKLYPLRPRYLVLLINRILRLEGATVAAETIDNIARTAGGDIRSAINDAQAAAAGVFIGRGTRISHLDESETLKRLFSPNYGEARRALNETELPLYRDELLLLIHDLLPYIYTSPPKLASAYEALSRVDITYARIGVNRSRNLAPPPFNMPRRDSVPQWSLLPVALNELASVGVNPPDSDVGNAVEVGERISQKTVERYQYRLWSIDHVCRRLARICHTSKRTVLCYVLPFLVAIFRINEETAREAAAAMELEERDIAFLAAEANATTVTSGSEEALDPAEFKLPFMGKDKFVQLMRAGIKYDSGSRKFSVRRMDNLDSIEESLSQIIARPVKFIRTDAPRPPPTEGGVTKLCYADGNLIDCETCKFLDDCPTHTLTTREYCLCDETVSDPKGYEKYLAKGGPTLKSNAKPRRMATPRKRVKSAGLS